MSKTRNLMKRPNNPSGPIRMRNNRILNISQIPNIFINSHAKYAMKGNRIYGGNIQKEAIYIDNQGNKVILRQRESCLSTTEKAPGISYESHSNFGKYKYKKSKN